MSPDGCNHEFVWDSSISLASMFLFVCMYVHLVGWLGFCISTMLFLLQCGVRWSQALCDAFSPPLAWVCFCDLGPWCTPMIFSFISLKSVTQVWWGLHWTCASPFGTFFNSWCWGTSTHIETWNQILKSHSLQKPEWNVWKASLEDLTAQERTWRKETLQEIGLGKNSAKDSNCLQSHGEDW